MRIAITDVVGVGQAQAAEQVDGRALGLVLAGDAVADRGLDALVDQLVRGIERGSRRLCHVGNPRAPERAFLLLADLKEAHAIESDSATSDAAARTRVAHGSEADGGLARAGLADQPQHLAP